jgi:hypothetical protein
MKPSVNIPNALASIQTRYLPNTSQRYYHRENPLAKFKNTSQIYYHRENPLAKSKFFYTSEY